jgi:hypothetical protein
VEVRELEWGDADHIDALATAPYDVVIAVWVDEGLMSECAVGDNRGMHSPLSHNQADCVYPWADADKVIQDLLRTVAALSGAQTDVLFCGINIPQGETATGESPDGLRCLDVFLARAPVLFDCYLMCVDPTKPDSAGSRGSDNAELFPSVEAYQQCRGVWLLRQKQTPGSRGTRLSGEEWQLEQAALPAEQHVTLSVAGTPLLVIR